MCSCPDTDIDPCSLKSSLKPARTENLHLNTFAERNFRKQKSDVVTLHLESCNDENVKVSVLLLFLPFVLRSRQE